MGLRVSAAVGRVTEQFGALGVSDARIASSQVLFERYGWLLVFASTISPLSTKLTCIAAGAFGLPFVQFVPALFVGRAVRFGVLVVLLRYAGEHLAERLARRTDGRAREQVEGLHDRVLARTPAGRWGEPGDLAGVAVFLASPASDFVTGAAIPVDGGFSVQG